MYMFHKINLKKSKIYVHLELKKVLFCKLKSKKFHFICPQLLILARSKRATEG